MRKSLLKTIAATAVVGAVLSISSVTAIAATVTSKIGTRDVITSDNTTDAKFGTTINLAAEGKYAQKWVTSGSVPSSKVTGTYMDLTFKSNVNNNWKNNGSMFNSPTYKYSSKGVVLTGGSESNQNIVIDVKQPGTLVIDYCGESGNRFGSITYDSTKYTFGKTGSNDKGIQTYFDISSSELGEYTLTGCVDGSDNKYIAVYAIGFIVPSTTPEINGLPSTATLNLTDGIIELSAEMNDIAQDAGYSIKWVSNTPSKATVGETTGIVTATSDAEVDDEIIITAKLVDSEGADVKNADDEVIKMDCTVKITSNFTLYINNPAGASLSTTKGTFNSAKTQLTLNSGETATITATKDNYYLYKTDTLSATSENPVNISMTKFTASSNGTNVFDVGAFNVPSTLTPSSNTEILSINGETFNVNGFSSTTDGKIKLYAAGSTRSIAFQTKSSVKYTPSVDGVIIINAAANGGSAGDRGFTFTGGDTNETYLFEGTDFTSLRAIKYDVKAGTEYKFQITYKDGENNPNAGAVKVDYIKFVSGTAATATDYNATDLYALDTSNNVTYIIHKVSAAEASKSTLTESTTGISTQKAYKKVIFGDNTSIEASDVNAYALFAFKSTTKAEAPTATLNWQAE